MHQERYLRACLIMEVSFHQISKCFSFLLLFGEVYASSEVSIDLMGYVDPEVNIERVDDNGTLNIFGRNEARFRVTSNVDDNVRVTFKSQNNWKLIHRDDPEKFIPYEGLFRGNNKIDSVILNPKTEFVTVDKNDFVDKEYEFGVIFKPVAKIKIQAAGSYYGRVTISVSSAS